VYLASFFGGLLLLVVSLVTQFYVSGYTDTVSSSPVTDIILSNIRTYNVGGIFVYGSFLLLFFSLVVVLPKSQYAPFAMKSVALFTLIRSLFVILTHISIFPTRIVIESAMFSGAIWNGIFSGNDLFFSGHTGLPFLLALMFWHNKNIRAIFLGFSITFAVVVLLGHIHYSIDVLAAYFITYSIFQICKYLFKREWEIFSRELSTS